MERLGVPVHERTAVTGIEPGLVTTDRGRVRAQVVVRATEGFTAQLPGQRRAIAPVYSLMVATEPLPDEVWSRIGLAHRETFTDERHLIVYGQRTADNRLAFGGRGAPYHFSSQIRPEHDRDPQVFAALRRVLVEMLPPVQEAAFTHAWGGPLGIARDWCASVGLDKGTGLAWAGGYVGDGVSTTNLAGRTLRDLVLGLRHRSGDPAVGEPPLAPVGAGAAALARGQRVAARDGWRGRRGAADRPAVPPGCPADATAGPLTPAAVPSGAGRRVPTCPAWPRA